MTAQEIKSLLHEGIENIDDKKFLEAIKTIFDSKYRISPSLKISKKRKQILKDRREQIRKGNYFTHDEVKKLSKEWSKE